MAKKDKDKDKTADTVKPIEGSEEIQPKNIQEIAKANFEKSAALAKEGKQAPPLPATPVNLASFQNRENLPAEKRKGLEPVPIEGHSKQNEGSVTDSILGSGDGPTGPVADLGGRTTAPIKTPEDNN